jgi:hypothetical protein
MDKSESEKLSVIKALQGAKKLIKSPANWCQGHMVRDDKGQRVGSIWAQEATKYCGYAALARVCVKPSDDEAHDLHHKCLLIMHKALREIEGKEECSIVVYNDRHTHDDMLSLFDKAIELVGSNDEEETEVRERPPSRNATKQEDSRVPSGHRGRKSDLRGGHDSDSIPEKETKRRGRKKS